MLTSSGAVLGKKIFWGRLAPHHLGGNNEQNYCVPLSSIKQLMYRNYPENLRAWARFGGGGLCPPGPYLEPPLDGVPLINSYRLFNYLAVVLYGDVSLRATYAAHRLITMMLTMTKMSTYSSAKSRFHTCSMSSPAISPLFAVQVVGNIVVLELHLVHETFNLRFLREI